MPIIYFSGQADSEQARGPQLDNGQMIAYAINKENPTRMVSLGGHRMDDAPTYNVSEGKLAPHYIRKNGRNVVEERQLSADYIMSTVLNLMLPDRLISVTDLIFNNQRKNKYDIVLLPKNCDTECDEYFLLGDDMKLGVSQAQNSLIGFGDNEAPINYMRTARFTGNFQKYLGTNDRTLSEATEALYAVLIVEDDCDGSDCPYQTIVRGGAAPGLGDAVLEYSTDGGASWTTIVTTALTADMIITDLKYVNGYLIVSYSDVAAATGTDGGFAYSFGIGPALALATLDVASLGIQTMEVVNGNIYGFGTGGETYRSCDNGLTYVKDTTSTITVTVLDSSYDRTLDLIYLAGATAEAWTYDKINFVQIDADFSPTAATDLESVEVTRPGGGVAFGGADGNYYQTWNFGGLGSGTWTQDTFGAGSIGAIASDGFGYRTFIGHATDIKRRSVLTEQLWQNFTTAPVGNITAIEVGKPEDDEGVNYFVVVTDTGETYVIAKCVLCFDEC